MVAPKSAHATYSRDIYEDGVGDYRGRYKDGAFYSEPAFEDGDEESSEADEDPQTKYFNGILTKFHLLREQLQQTPPLELLQKLDEDHPIYLGQLLLEKVKWWRWKLRTTDPLPVQVASMDKDTILGLLKLMAGGALLRRGTEVEMGVSRWAWSLLAKLPERGELSSEEIGIVRELGKKAVLVAVGLRSSNPWEEGMQEVEAEYDGEDDEILEVVNNDEITIDEEEVFDPELDFDHDVERGIKLGPVREEKRAHGIVEDAELGTIGNISPNDPSIEVDELAAAKARMLGLLSTPTAEPEYNVEPEILSPLASIIEDEDDKVTPVEKTGDQKWNSNATVDMILTIAGEVYGQRDLLEFRGSWGQIV